MDGACGTGRVLFALAGAGHQVTGVDVSPAMLKIAGSKVGVGHPPTRVRLAQADLRHMDLGERYGMALVALGSFPEIAP